jgi:hypothetical protein
MMFLDQAVHHIPVFTNKLMYAMVAPSSAMSQIHDLDDKLLRKVWNLALESEGKFSSFSPVPEPV